MSVDKKLITRLVSQNDLGVFCSKIVGFDIV